MCVSVCDGCICINCKSNCNSCTQCNCISMTLKRYKCKNGKKSWNDNGTN